MVGSTLKCVAVVLCGSWLGRVEGRVELGVNLWLSCGGDGDGLVGFVILTRFALDDSSKVEG